WDVDELVEGRVKQIEVAAEPTSHLTPAKGNAENKTVGQNMMPPPEGRSKSATEIELHLLEPDILKGILEPYRLTCLNATNTTTSSTVENLHLDTPHQCLVEVSTILVNAQDPVKCERHSKSLSHIQSMPASELESSYYIFTLNGIVVSGLTYGMM
uniref:Uncharacterized protein n=1 Tax=Echinococcus canadensis TaxID=519352 RepID=A0A915EYT2_9CEST